MNRPKRILLVSEASYQSTGYSILSQEFASRWHKAGYEIYELGCNAQPNDPRQTSVPWNFAPNLPNPNNEEEKKAYFSSQENCFGAWKFEEACLWSRCDIAVAFRDSWMDAHMAYSPFRSRYHLALMPPVDCWYQDENWLDVFMRADSLLTYTKWSYDVLKEQGGVRLPLVGVATPGVDTEVFKPVPDRRAHKQACGLDPNINIVGMVARNQRRKLFPDLLEGMQEFYRTAPPELAAKTYIYLHTAWPDVGWDIPRLLKEFGVANKTLFTYACRQCGYCFPSFFQDTKAFCKKCGNQTATFPVPQVAISRETVASITNLFDTYVQYCNSEGLGLPLLEAAACGVPIMATDYSAMADVVKNLGGTPIKVAYLYREPETHCRRAMPDLNDFVTKLTDLLLQPDAMRNRMGYLQREAVKPYANWDTSSKVWMDIFEKAPLRDWSGPPQLHQPVTQIPQGLSDYQFIQWGLANVAGRPELIGGFQALEMARDLSWGYTTNGMVSQAFTREVLMKTFLGMAERRNAWEMRRAQICQA